LDILYRGERFGIDIFHAHILLERTIMVDDRVSRNPIKPTGKRKSLMPISSDMLPCIQKNLMRKVFGIFPRSDFQEYEAVYSGVIFVIEFAESFRIAGSRSANQIVFVL